MARTGCRSGLRPGPSVLTTTAVFLAALVTACRPPKPPESPAAAQQRADSEAFAQREIYTRLTVDILCEIPDDKVEQAVIDFIQHKVGDRLDAKRALLRRMPAGIRAMDATWGVEVEVAGGGFRRYFRNTRGEYAGDAVTGFRLFGHKPLAELMEQAIVIAVEEQAGGPVSKVDRYRALDLQFPELARDLSERRIALIRARPKLFIGE